MKRMQPLSLKKKEVKKSNTAITYTRVSTKEQFDTNASLDTQLKFCKEWCLKRDIQIIEEFGGTFESAKSNDARDEFTRMIQFAKKKENNVQFIVVYSLDRFSRTGGSAITLIQELSSLGIQLIAVTQQTDVTTAEGQFQTGILMLASKYDNDLRRKRIIDGMREKLKNGYCMSKPPLGYTLQIINGKKIAMPDENSNIIKQAFDLKEKGFTNNEILDQLNLSGLKLNHNRLLLMFRNPFYCGYIKHALLGDDILPGIHEGLISEHTFQKINNGNIYYEKAALLEDTKFPLKSFILCAKCGTKWTGYTMKSRSIDYYKCNKMGCKCNKNANDLHNEFAKYLQRFKMPQNLLPEFKNQLSTTFQNLNQHYSTLKVRLIYEKGILENKITNCVKRHAIGEISKEVYSIGVSELKTELMNIESELSKLENHLSNKSKFLDFALGISENIDQIWLSSNTTLKVKLQYLIFPMGIQYNKEDSTYRTNKTNSIFELIASFSYNYIIKNKEQHQCCPSNSHLVVPARIELASKV